MRKLNFLFKILLAFFFIGFAVWYQNLAYNLLLIILCAIILRKEKITLFRFPRQGYFFAFLLFLMFLFRAFNGYGKVLLQLPSGLSLTGQGLEMAAIFVSQLILVFMIFGIAIYSTEREQFLYYLKRLEQRNNPGLRELQRFAQIAMYVMYLLPKSLDYRRKISGELQNEFAGKPLSWRGRFGIVMENVYRFMSGILYRSEEEFSSFVERNNSAVSLSPLTLMNARHLWVVILVAGFHTSLIWNRL